jgi:hypothetical protein
MLMVTKSSTQLETPLRAYPHRVVSTHHTPCFIMSQTPPTTTSHPNYRPIFDSALEAYKKKTGKDLTSDPLLRRLEACHSADDILNILQEHITGFDQPHSSDRRDGLTKWLNPTVNVLYTISITIGNSFGVSL